MSRPSFAKRDRDRAKKARAEEKRQRRQAATVDGIDQETDGVGPGCTPAYGGPSTPELLRMVEDLHRRYDAGEMAEDEFQTVKADLLGRLTID
jgi:hypothetical protein